MIRVRNAHGALCHGILPGAEGDVDESNRGVAAALAANPPLLVRVEATSLRVAASPAEDAGALRARFDEAWAEREARYAEVSESRSRDHDEALRRKDETIAGLEADRSEAASRAASLEGELAAARLDVEKLTAANAKLQADLDGMLAAPPKVDPPPAAEAEPASATGRTTRKG